VHEQRKLRAVQRSPGKRQPAIVRQQRVLTWFAGFVVEFAELVL
jgi:hypothetical protein